VLDSLPAWFCRLGGGSRPVRSAESKAMLTPQGVCVLVKSPLGHNVVRSTWSLTCPYGRGGSTTPADTNHYPTCATTCGFATARICSVGLAPDCVRSAQ